MFVHAVVYEIKSVKFHRNIQSTHATMVRGSVGQKLFNMNVERTKTFACKIFVKYSVITKGVLYETSHEKRFSFQHVYRYICAEVIWNFNYLETTGQEFKIV